MHERILQAASDLFSHFGYSKTTADEIASRSGVSKRTLYKYCKSKRDLLDHIISNKLEYIRKELQNVLGKEMDFSEKLRQITTHVAVVLGDMSSHFLDDLHRNVPEVWERISGFRKEMIHVYFPMLLDEGIKQGHFKADINKGVAVLLMMNAMEIVINPTWTQSLPDDLAREVPLSPERLFDNIIEIIYDGIHAGESIFKDSK